MPVSHPFKGIVHGGNNRPGSTGSQPPTRLDQVRQVLRLHHDAIHTERAALEGIVRDVRVHRRRSRDARCPPAPNLEAFLHTAITGAVRRASLRKHSSAHTIRHSCVTHLRQRGTDLRPMQHRLGHQDLATTMIDTHGLPQGGQGVPSPLDDLGV